MRNPMNLTGKNILMVHDESSFDKTIKNQLEEFGASITLYKNTNVITIESDIKKVVEEFGAFDGVVFSVVHSDFKPLQFVKPELVNNIMYDNFGMFVEVMRCLKKSKGLVNNASVVAMSSISSIRAMKAKMAFCASKAALDAAIRCLAVELGDKGIRVNSIQKGGVDIDFEKEHIQDINSINDGATTTKQILGITRVEEIINVIAFLLSDATKTITGTSIIIDGGYTL